MLLLFGIVSAQGTKTVAVKVSNQTQMLNNKEYYVHIVEQGQTVFSIARAYGLKYYDAVIKTDIHLMKVGDTVWLPKNENSVAAVIANAEAQLATDRVHYIKVDAGQTLYSISREYGLTVDDLVEANPELKHEQLKAGQMLKIPPRKTTSTDSEGRKPMSGDQRTETEQTRAVQPVQPAQPVQSAQSAQSAQSRPAATKPSETKPSETKPIEAKPVETKPVEAKPVSEKPVQANAVNPQESTPDARLPKPVVNPYPFDEVPANFPTTPANYFNFTTTSNFAYQVRDRQSKDKLYVSIVMPLNLDKIEQISTSKFDIEQRGKKEYKVFEFIQFYEGILMALDKLQQQGVNVVLNVVDLSSDSDEDVVKAFNSHNVANSDFIIALLVKKPFNKLAQLAKDNQVFVINPFSSRIDVIKNNPYVVKCMPSIEGTVKGMLDVVARRHKNGNLLVVHSTPKMMSLSEKEYYDEFQRQLELRKDIKYTFFDWAANGKLVSTLKGYSDNVIISIYDQDKNKNTVYATTLLNRLSVLTSNVPVLMTTSNYLNDLPNLDFEQLQHVSYTTVTMGFLDYNNERHRDFIDTYKEKFRTEPNTLYAGVAHDIMLYFCSALWQKGAEFWRNPQQFKAPSDMLFPYSLKQPSSLGGYENQSPDIYQMQNFKLVPLTNSITQ